VSEWLKQHPFPFLRIEYEQLQSNPSAVMQVTFIHSSFPLLPHNTKNVLFISSANIMPFKLYLSKFPTLEDMYYESSVNNTNNNVSHIKNVAYFAMQCF